MKKGCGTILAMILFLSILTGSAQAFERFYTEGTVWNITFVKTVEGMEDVYLKELKAVLKPLFDEAKKEGLILSYRIFSSPAATPGDWNMMLMTEFENMAALDGLEEKFIAIYERLVGTAEDFEKGAVRRNKIREILGDKLARELIFK